MKTTDDQRGLDRAPTTAYPTPSQRRPPPRCRVAWSAESSGFRTEVEQLLHQRLKLVSLIVLAPCLAMFVGKLFSDGHNLHVAGLPFLAMHGAVCVVLAGLTALVWLKPCLTLRALRGVELTLFGVLAAFFAFMQIEQFYGDQLYEAMARAGETPGLPLQRLVATSTSFRWFFLIVIYGVFIPNTWKRCALLCSSTVLAALLLTAVPAALKGRLADGLLAGLGDQAILLATAVVVAVFGAYRLQVLQREAFEAKQLGQYKLKRRLGAGGMGEVYEAEHLLLRRPCALKLIRSDQAGDPTNLQRFEREVQAMARLTHWNTVEVFDYGHADDGTFYYVMEYLPGQNLDTLVARHGPLPACRAVHFLRQVCRALREAHGIGLLHRDIKPSNLFACERGGVYDVAKLLDFGLVQNAAFGPDADKLTTQGTVVGSPPFMSPEQAMGKSNLDPRSDIYSVGAVAYYLLTGQPPFPRETAMQMLLAHAYEAAPPPSQLRPEVPSDLEAVVLGCLQKKPEERFPSADSLEKALARCACANDWTEEKAAAWWRETPAATTETTDQMAALPTTQFSVRGGGNVSRV
jgi:serine/threonine-protein kinase